VQFAVESWSPDYGAPTGQEALAESTTNVDHLVEASEADWRPQPAPPTVSPLLDVVFVDGVRRVEANVWITDAAGGVHQGICASYAAGAVQCNGSAEVVAAEVRRGLFCPAEGAAPIDTRHAHFALHVSTHDAPDQLSLDLQRKMGELEAHVAAQASGAEVYINDGPLKIGQHRTDHVGFIKTHHTSYGPDLVRQVVARLGCNERTPLLLIGDRVRRFTWYVRLPCDIGHGWAGIVRIETTADQPLADAIGLADRLAVTLPRFASHPQKDPRAPQNLYPIGGLERDLRHRLGDAALILRSLREAAAAGRRAPSAPGGATGA
jgi:hypothetical protein